MSQSDLTRRLTAADPAAPHLIRGDGLQDSLDRLGTAISATPRLTQSPRRASPRRPRRVVLVALAATAVLAGSAAAATTLLSARTGQHARGWQVRAGGPGEYLRESAPDFCRVALQVSASVPYPPGDEAWRRWVLIAEDGVRRVHLNGSCRSSNQRGSAQVSTGAQRGYFAMSAFCAWIYDWRHASQTGNQAVSAQASREIAAAPGWPAVRAEDPHPSAGPLHQTRGGLTGSHTMFGWFLPFGRAVSRGDLSTVNRLIASNYGTAGCAYFDPPAASRNGTVNPLGAKS